MTATEYYLPGTEPTKSCTCHVRVTVCKDSGQQAAAYCENTEDKIYLRSATKGTLDEAFVMPAGLDKSSCEKHQHFWSNWFNKADESMQEHAPEGSGWSSGGYGGSSGSPNGNNDSTGRNNGQEDLEDLGKDKNRDSQQGMLTGPDSNVFRVGCQENNEGLLSSVK